MDQGPHPWRAGGASVKQIIKGKGNTMLQLAVRLFAGRAACTAMDVFRGRVGPLRPECVPVEPELM
jgi:hypothetical protein